MSEYAVVNRRTGNRFGTQAGESLLAAARRNGIFFPYSCLIGSCDGCLARLVEGSVHYPLLDPEPKGPSLLLCQAVALSPLVIDAPEYPELGDFPSRRVPLRLEQLDELAPSLFRLRLRAPRGQLPAYLAGQYLDFLLIDGRRRAFSIAKAPDATDTVELHIKRQAGGFSEDLTAVDGVGRTFPVEMPQGTMYLRQSTRDIVAIAGGTGIAPLKAIAEAWLEDRGGRQFSLFWGGRNRNEIYLDHYFRELAQAHSDFSYAPVVEEPHQRWERGLVHEVALREDRSDADIYVSGPPGLVSAVQDKVTAAGLSRERLFFDSFENAPDVALGCAGLATAV